MNKLLAQELKISGVPIRGPLPTGEFEGINDVVNKVLQFLYPVAGVILFIILVWGGYSFMSSKGEPDKVKSAKAMITAGIVGFILLILSFFIVRIIAFILGLGGETL